MLFKIFNRIRTWLRYHGLTEKIMNCAKERFGTGCDAWDLSVEALRQNSIVYSCGVGENISFDIDIIRRFGLTVHAFDPTPRSIEWAIRQRLPDSFILHPYGITDYDGLAVFYPPNNPDHVSYSILCHPSAKAGAVKLPVKRLTTIMKDLGHTRLDVLKLDIEGSEYNVITDMAKTLIRPSQLLVEFHHHLPCGAIRETRKAIKMILRMGYTPFSVSETGHEFSFLWLPDHAE